MAVPVRRTALPALGLTEVSDTVHQPHLPSVWLLRPEGDGLVLHRWWLGYWYWGRPSLAELHAELRAVTRSMRPDWEPARP